MIIPTCAGIFSPRSRSSISLSNTLLPLFLSAPLLDAPAAWLAHERCNSKLHRMLVYSPLGGAGSHADAPRLKISPATVAALLAAGAKSDRGAIVLYDSPPSGKRWLKGLAGRLELLTRSAR